jgi:hypothetical protein
VGCSVDPYFLPGGDEPDPDACVPGALELCNERDDNCDGVVDEGFSLSSDLFNCGACGAVCGPPNALPGCDEGECRVERCLPGTADLDLDPGNGCEVLCSVSETVRSGFCAGPDCCDAVDNDCDGEDGEDHDTTSDPDNCGGCASTCDAFPCSRVCAAPFAETACVAGGCVITGCLAGYEDLDLDPVNGCEYRCTQSGAEACDGLDNDCDGATDEDCDCTDGGVRGCGGSPNDGVCEQRCAGGAWGACEPTGEGAETCDGLDTDCNGPIDDGLALASSSCGDLIDGQGVRGCRSGVADACTGYVPARPEVCDEVDNDGDDDIDEDATCVGAGAVCQFGQCVIPCQPMDAPLQCPIGMRCVDDLCLGSLCADVTCGECERCDESTGSCVSQCTGLACSDGLVCHCGRCWPPTCGVLGCPAGEACRDGSCAADACADDPCAASEGCADGECFGVCARDQCGTGEVCVRGACVEDECRGVVCGGDECDPRDGSCSARCVSAVCSPGLVCDLASGRCVDDPCARVHCPEGSSCERGSCVELAPPGDGGPDADVETDGGAGTWIFATGGGGGGGCAGCAAATSARPASLALLLAGALAGALAAGRRRR